MGNFEIMIADITDIPQILEIKKQSHEYFVKSKPDIYTESDILYTEDFLQDFFQSESKHVIITKIENRIVGYAFVQSINIQLPMMTNRMYVYVHDMAVLMSFRNHGIATGLLEYIENYSLKIGASSIELAVHLFCKNAISLYRKNGFNARTIRMEKQLIRNLYET